MTMPTETFWDLIEDVRTCMLVTHDPETGLAARPMHAIVERDAQEVWFYTELDSEKASEIKADQQVCLTFGCPRTNNFVSATGRARLVRDHAKIKEHWNTFVDAWFPQGPDEASVGMICVKVEKGEYWDSHSSRIVSALKMIVASQQNERPDLGENARVAFN